MRVLIAFCLLLVCLRGLPPDPYLLIFSNDGSFYRVNPVTRHVHWHSSLRFRFISFDFDPGTFDSKAQNSTYFVPTIDGNFVYIDRNRQILIDRNEVETLLNVCFDQSQDSSPRLVHDSSKQYFLYKKYDYYVIDLQTGQAEGFETFLKQKTEFKPNKFAVAKVSKKYLKQLGSELQIKWSIISSTLDLVTAEAFFKNPKTSARQNIEFLNTTGFEFYRSGNQIEFVNSATNTSFEIGSNSPVLAIFSYLGNVHGFLKHSFKNRDKTTLAISYKPGTGKKSHTVPQCIRDINQSKEKGHEMIFPHSQQFQQQNSDKDTRQFNQVEFCINTFRSVKGQLQEQQEHEDSSKAQIHLHFHSKPANKQELPYYPFTPDPTLELPKEPRPTKEQPYFWIGIILGIIGVGFIVSRAKVNALLNEVNDMENQTGKKFQQIQRKLGEFERMQKFYQVYWNKIVYNSSSDGRNPGTTYDYMIFEGKFLGQETFVYAVRLEGTDILSIEHELNKLINCSFKSICKLYYYTRNTDFLLIITEKVRPITRADPKETFACRKPYQRMLLSEIIEAIQYLQGHISIPCLPFEAIMLENIESAEEKENEKQKPPIQLRVNVVPCLLVRPLDQSDRQDSNSGQEGDDISPMRMSLVELFYYIHTKGNAFNLKTFQREKDNQDIYDQLLMEFYSTILYESKIKPDDSLLMRKDSDQLDINGDNRQELLALALNHPYLWDSKRKILFLSDFSNYIQTYIDETKGKKIETFAKDFAIIKFPWTDEFPPILTNEIMAYRKYDSRSVRDLFRAIRNKLNHFHELPKQIKAVVGKTPEQFVEFCLARFPKLLQFAYIYSRKKKWKLHMK